MSRYRCLIVDDEELARELIETHLSQLSDFEIVASCASAIEASDVLKEHAIDLLFLDIEMPVLKGTDFYKNLLHKPKVIFTTAFRDYAVDGFDLDAVDYLLKPIVFARFFKAIERFIATVGQGQRIGQEAKTDTPPQSTIHREGTSLSSPHIFVRKDRKQVKITLQEILYVQGLKDYIQVFTTGGSHIIKQRLSAFALELGDGFIRIHRSYIVNRDKITAVSKQDVELGELEIPVGDSYKSTLFAALNTLK